MYMNHAGAVPSVLIAYEIPVGRPKACRLILNRVKTTLIPLSLSHSLARSPTLSVSRGMVESSEDELGVESAALPELVVNFRVRRDYLNYSAAGITTGNSIPFFLLIHAYSFSFAEWILRNYAHQCSKFLGSFEK